MSGSALDDRTFETAESVELSREQQDSNLQHFRDKGYDVEVVDDNAPPATDPEPETPPAELPPAEEQPATAVVDHPDADEDTKREFEAAQKQPDGEKLGRWAKKNRLIREQAREIATTNGQLEEARRQLAERDKTPAVQSAPATPTASPFVDPVIVPPAAASPAPAKKEFDKPEPKLPEFDDFVNEDDPIKAHANAVGKYAKDVVKYERERDAFESTQTRAQEQQTSQERQQQEVQSTRLAAAQQAYPDFMEVIKPAGKDVQYGEVLQYLLRDELPDGYDLAYHLARPENSDFFNKLRNDVAVTKGEDPQSVGRKITTAAGELAVFRHEMKKKTAAPPAGSVPAPSVPVAARPQQTPPAAVPPRREEAAPSPIRGNGAPAQRLEDIDPMDSDARRAFKRAQGIM